MRKIYLLLIMAVSCLTTMAQEETTNQLDYIAPDWNDYPMTFVSDGNWKSSTTYSEFTFDSNTTSTLTATVTVDGDATLCYDLFYGEKLTLIVDGENIRSFNHDQLYANLRYFHELTAGEHTIQWVATAETSRVLYSIRNIGVEKTPLITVNLLEPGSLGTEILYNVDHVKDVRKLKIIGSMNDADWAVIDMMKGNLFTIDLSETDVTEISDKRFQHHSSSSNWQYLHSVVLPKGLKKIGNGAFYGTYLSDIKFPSTLESIDNDAFCYSSISSAILPESCLTLGTKIFRYCYFLTETSLPNKLTAIPSNMYEDCCDLKNFKLPDELTSIGSEAFMNCYYIAPDLPEKLTSIGQSAFNGTNQFGEKTRLILPPNLSDIKKWNFENTKYTYVEMPVSYYTIGNECGNILPNTTTVLRLNCPTVVEKVETIIHDQYRPNITLQVPSFLVNAYKLDSYWYEFGAIEGFDTDEIDEWVLNSDLVLGARDRLEGTPTVKINEKGSLKINGTEGMAINNLSYRTDPDNSAYGRMFSNADEVTVNGDLWMDFRAGTANRWYFLSLPYNIKVSDIYFTNNNPKRAIRYYDGANRAANGAGGSWKDFADDDIIPAGTGFIFQVSEAGWWRFPAPEDESKQYLTSNKMFVKALAANPSETTANSGWNLVGNPYQCWYNIHKLNFTAPITVYNASNKTYSAYSIIDDDYAIAPNQAFFVQCPDGVSEISFPIDGRQMTSVIESQSGAKPHGYAPATAERTLIDLTVSNGTLADRTRVVINEKATAGYDVNSDAAKFMSDDATVPQLYSYDADGTACAINERPEGDGKVLLGFSAGDGGCFTIGLSRETTARVELVDNELGVSKDLSSQDYTFTAGAGIYDNRFELRVSSGNEATAISDIQKTDNGRIAVKNIAGGIEVNGHGGSIAIYTAAGVCMAEGLVNGTRTYDLPAGTYIVKSGEHVTKVAVK